MEIELIVWSLIMDMQHTYKRKWLNGLQHNAQASIICNILNVEHIADQRCWNVRTICSCEKPKTEILECPTIAVNKFKWCLINNSKMKFSNGEEPDCSPPTSAGHIPADITFYFIIQHCPSVLCSCCCQLYTWLAHGRRSRRALLSIVTWSSVTLTCMAGLLLGFPPHLNHTLITSPSAHTPPLFNCIFVHLHLRMSILLPSCLPHLSILPSSFTPLLCPPSPAASHPSFIPPSRSLSSLTIPRAPPLHPFLLPIPPHPHYTYTHTHQVFEAAAAVTQRCSRVCGCDHYATSPTLLEYWWAAGSRQGQDKKKTLPLKENTSFAYTCTSRMRFKMNTSFVLPLSPSKRCCSC